MLVFFKLMHYILYFEEEFSQMSSKNKVADERIVGTPILKFAMNDITKNLSKNTNMYRVQVVYSISENSFLP